MCGFAGFVGAGSYLPTSEWKNVLRKMGQSMVHRGPDDEGIWFDCNFAVGLVHRRLAILDLSATGKQPMVSASGRYVMVFNGEIYNHQELRLALESVVPFVPTIRGWRGRSDTETILAAFDVWGIAEAAARTIGMFAFAVWDRDRCTLTLGRDRLGEKPLYYGWQNDTFLFGSELKALKAHPVFCSEISRNAIALLMRHSYIPAPNSIYQDIHKLIPGSLLTVSPQNREAHLQRFWDARNVISNGVAHPFLGSPDDAVEALDGLLTDAVAKQMVADVPLGAFLSGGIDSSAVVALMQSKSSRPVKTFTIGFQEQSHNEAEHAKVIARHLGTDHTELYVTPQQALAVIPRLPTVYDEPFSDSSQIPTFLVSQMTRDHVTVALSGDGGDELFGGYSRYFLGERLWNLIAPFPAGLRLGLARMIRRISPQRWNRLVAPCQSLLSKSMRKGNVGDRLHKGAGMMAAKAPGEFYRLLISHWPKPDELVIGATEPPTVLTESGLQPQTDNFFHQMMALDLLSYLPDDILTKVDRAAMAVSLETRVPFLDHRVVEFAWSLPIDYMIRDGAGKWPLRQVLYRYVPKHLIERPKMGFGVPIRSWLRGPLRDWAESLLDESRLRNEGYFRSDPIRQKWQEHLSGARNWHYYLWDVLMFQAWLGEQK